MPNCDNSSCISSNGSPYQHHHAIGGYKDVVIIGNGPSGLCLSYFLSGHWPYWNKGNVQDEFLQVRLQNSDNGLSLVEQDLEYLSNGLEGRSNHPISLLYDKLKHPDGDMGLDLPSCLNWHYDPLKEIDHVCIGKGPGPGGAWNDLDGSQLTISPSRWMELPDMSYADWKRQLKANMNAGLVFSSKNSNFSEDTSLLNANYTRKPNISPNTNRLNQSHRQASTEDARVTMHDVKLYYRDYARQKNLDKYLLNNATVTNVRRVSKCFLSDNGHYHNHHHHHNNYYHNHHQGGLTVNQSSPALSSLASINNCSSSTLLWEVTGLIDKRDRKKASSLTKGDIMEFKFYCKHLVLANGTTDLHNELHVKGENMRYVLRTIRELEDKIKDDLARLQKDPLLVVGSGLSAADAILLAQKYSIKIVHVIRRSVHDSGLIFNKLPKKIYPEYQRVYEQMIHNRYNPESSPDIKNNDQADKNYTLYDEYQVKSFTSKRTCVLTKINQNLKCEDQYNQPNQYHNNQQSQHTLSKCLNQASVNRHLTLQKHHHQSHQRQLKEFDEDTENMTSSSETSPNTSRTLGSLNDSSLSCSSIGSSTSSGGMSNNNNALEIKFSYACVLIGYSPNLEFLPPDIVNSLALDPSRLLDAKDNPVNIDELTHETINHKNLYAMGPLIGDNFVRFGTGGALAICSSIVKSKKMEKKQLTRSLNGSNTSINSLGLVVSQLASCSVYKKNAGKENSISNANSRNGSNAGSNASLNTAHLIDLKSS